MNNQKILIIEDDDFQCEIYEKALAEYQLVRAVSASQALALIPKEMPDLLILDHVLADGELGLSFLQQFRELLPFIPIVIVSGALEVHQQLEALQGPRRAHYCLTKPLDIHDLRGVVATALKECGEKEVVHQFEALARSRRVDALDLFSRTTDRLTRQNQVLEFLGRNTERPSISFLARHFKVHRRTIIRDLQDLIRRGQLQPDVYPDWDKDEE